MNELVINDLVKYVTFQYNNAKHVNDMMLKAFPFIAETGYTLLKCIKKDGRMELTKVEENRTKNLNFIKE